MKKYAEGGIYTAEMGQPPMNPDGGSAPAPAPRRPMGMRGKMPPEGAMMKREGRGMAKEKMQEKKKPMGYAKGGSVSARADGIAKRGKTNCKMV